MTPDFKKHRCTFLLYPSRQDVWRKKALPARKAVCSLCNIISQYEKVYLGTDADVQEELSPAVGLIDMDYNDIWVRDSGPVPVDGGAVAFGFNAWGGAEGLYADWSKDASVPEQIADTLDITLRKSSLILEGGNLACDGEGTLIAVKKAILNNNRNPGKSREETERELKSSLGVSKIIWLDRGLEYDETGGHVDNVCAFADDGKLFLAWTDDIQSPQYGVVRGIYNQINGETDALGRKIEIIKVPLPHVFLRSAEDCDGIIFNDGSKSRPIGEPIQASYINFVFVNGGVIIPQFGDENDEIALTVFRKHLTGLEVIPFNAREIILGGGGLHCITKNL